MIRGYVQKSISVTLTWLLLFQVVCPPSAFALSAEDKRRLEKLLTTNESPNGRGGTDSAPDHETAKPRDQGILHSDQVIRSGDVLYLSVSPADELSRDLIVDQNGRISIPLLGAIQASGKTTDQLGEEITKAIAKYVAHPKVDVFLKQSISKQIGLSGQVTLAGSYSYRPSLHLLDLISQAGGFLPSADRKKVRILRRSGSDRRVIVVNVDEIMASGDPNKDIVLEAGDLVEVSRGRGGIAIFGAVESPAVYDYMYDMRMIDLISMCHGFNESANTRRIMLIRGEGAAQKVSYIKFSDVVRNKPTANVMIQPGDIIYVPQKSLWATSAVAQAFSPIATLVLALATVILATKK